MIYQCYCNWKEIFVVRCVIWYHLYNLKNVKNTHWGVLILVKLYKWYQIAQRITFISFLRRIERCISLLPVLFQKCWVVVRMHWPKSNRTPCIQLFVLKDCLGVHKIAVCDTVHCNDSVQGTVKIFIEKIELDNSQSKIFWENRNLLEQDGYQGFCKVQIALLNIIATSRKHR